MASTNESPVDRVRAAVTRVERKLEPVLAPLRPAVGYVFSSFFRFMIFFGFVLILLGATVFGDAVAGHLGIYGVSSILVGALGRLIIYIKSPTSG